MKADVQLEHGYVRVANRLLEAILDAEFTGTQVRILLTLMRLTYGWRQKTAQIPVVELAAHCHLTNSGGFRRALQELVAQGVIVEVGRDIGQAVSVFAVQKDFTRWGRFSIAPARLEAKWGERPKHFDDRVQPTLFGSPLEGLPLTGPDPTGAERTPPQGQDSSPHRGVGTPLNSALPGELTKRKDSERQERHTSSPRPSRTREETLAAEVAQPLVDHFTAKGQNGDALWAIGEVNAALSGMHGPLYTEAEIRLAVTDYARMLDRTPSPFNARYFRRFLDGAREHLTRGGPTGTGATSGGNGSTDTVQRAAGVVFDDLVRWIQDAGGYRAMTVEKLRELPDVTRAALRKIGGHKAVCDADDTGRRVLRSRFCRVYGTATAGAPP